MSPQFSMAPAAKSGKAIMSYVINTSNYYNDWVFSLVQFLYKKNGSNWIRIRNNDDNLTFLFGKRELHAEVGLEELQNLRPYIPVENIDM